MGDALFHMAKLRPCLFPEKTPPVAPLVSTEERETVGKPCVRYPAEAPSSPIQVRSWEKPPSNGNVSNIPSHATYFSLIIFPIAV